MALLKKTITVRRATAEEAHFRKFGNWKYGWIPTSRGITERDKFAHFTAYIR